MADGTGTFVGQAGDIVDQLFAGSFHPEFGDIEKLLNQQIDDKIAKRMWVDDNTPVDEKDFIDMEYEYGFDEIEIQKDSILKKDNVLIIDDLIATGGTAIASAKLIEKFHTKKPEFFFVIDLYNLGGSKKLIDLNYNVTSLMKTLG